MDESIILSRYKIRSFMACPRQFQLRTLRRLPWPAPPLDERSETVRARGEQFHRLLERHFLNLPVRPQAIDDAEVRRWWLLFQNSGLRLPDGQLHPERSLTIPVGRHLLNGRFDLLITSSTAHIFDWKTGRPRDEAELRRDWQTRLYLALLAEGGPALGHPFRAEQIAITYWYVADHTTPRTIRYNEAWHKQNWADIQAIVAQIDDRLAADDWPLTDDWSHCRQCAYQVYCGRQAAGEAIIDASEEMPEPGKEALFLEPEMP